MSSNGTSSNAHAPLRLLLIENNLNDVSSFRNFLPRHKDVDLTVASDGGMGIRMALTLLPDLILVDARLPESTGQEVCKSIRLHEDARLCRTPIIVLAEKYSETEKIICRVIGADTYMTKPRNANDLFRALAKLLPSQKVKKLLSARRIYFNRLSDPVRFPSPS